MKRKSTITKAAVLVMSLSTLTPQAFAWGHKGHEAINETAAQLMQSPLKELFMQQSKSLSEMSTVPDRHWKKPDQGGNLEKKAHFFQWDRYSETLSNHMPVPIYKAVDLGGCEYVFENGTAVWRVQQLHDLLVQALKKKDWGVAVQMAGTMGHYVGDLSQPMHVTSDYDGQSINRPGIHAHFEIDVINGISEKDLHVEILKRAPKAFENSQNMSVVRMAFEEGKKALERLPSVLDIYAQEDAGDKDAAVEIAYETLAEGAATLAAVWDHAAEEANFKGILEDSNVAVGQPKWVAYNLHGSQDGPTRGCVK